MSAVRRDRTGEKPRRRLIGAPGTGRWAVVLVALLALIAPVAVPSAAMAAGSGVLSVTITPVDYATGDLQTTAGSGQHDNKVAYRVTYSCVAALCENTTVQLAPPQADPNGLAAQNPWTAARETLLRYSTWTPPAAGGTISGNDVTGKVVTLGDIQPGRGGSFLVVYDWTTTGTYNVIWAPQFYPGGFQLENTATISSPTATGSRTAVAAPVTWENVVPSPAMGRQAAAIVKPDVNLTYSLAMSSGSLISAGSGRIAGFDYLQAAGAWYVIEELPAEAEYVSSSDGGVYDSARHAVIWTRGYDTSGSYTGPVANAGGGWGASWFTQWSQSRGYNVRTVTVRFPAENFAAADANGCNFDADVNFNASTRVTYVDSAETEKTAGQTQAMTVSCWDPFGRGTITKDSTNDAGATSPRLVNAPPDVTGMTCPASGQDAWGRTCTPGQPLTAFAANQKYWEVNAYNAGNVPGVVTIVDDDLDHDGMPVYQITTSLSATIEYTTQCGTGAPSSAVFTGTNLQLTAAQIAAGCHIISARVTIQNVAATNIRPSQTSLGTRVYARFHYQVLPGTPVTGIVQTNTASGTISYPGYSLADVTLGPVSRSVKLREQPNVTLRPVIDAAVPVAPVVEGGGLAVPGSVVTFTVGGTTTNIPQDSEFVPQYVFIAPAGWTVREGSAAFAAGAVPDGVQFAYRTVTVGGVERQAVVATWPAGTVFGRNVTLPQMTVVAQPTYAVAAGTLSAYDAWIGDSQHFWDSTQATFDAQVQDAPDVDGDGDTTEWFSRAAGTILVSSSDALSIVKQICRPDSSQPDGCEWIGTPGVSVQVSTVASDIRYRVTIQNTGNTQISEVVGYDVLPFVGDFGTSDALADTPRGSEFEERLTAVENVSGDLELTYSDSTQPPRPEVYTGAGTSGDWTADVTGARAIRAEVDGALAPGETVSFEYTASVGAGAAADSVACNSVAVASDRLGVLEPVAVCATTAEADLQLTVPDRLPLQEGRPGFVPFTASNHGGSQLAPSVVELEIPEELRVDSLTPVGWTCAVVGDDDAALPVDGPTTLSCTANAPIAMGTPVALNLPVTPAEALDELCIDGAISGDMYDPDLTNNDASSCLLVAAEGGLVVDKTDGRTVVGASDGEYTYTVDVVNALVGEALPGVVITDELPEGVIFVSASDGGVLSGASAEGLGGTVTWPAVDLAAAGVPAADGDVADGASGSSVTRTVTVRVHHSAAGPVTNVARASAADPADGTGTIEDEAEDVDALRQLTLAKTSDAAAAGVRPGDVVEYTLTLRNTGTADFTAAEPAELFDDLSDVLDDAQFVAGSASARVDGGSADAVADPEAGILSWSGALPVGSEVVLTYRVTVGDGASGDRALVNAVGLDDDVDACVDGFDGAGNSCAVVESGFAPVLDKRVASLTQGEDGLWTIVYDIDVTNLDPSAAAVYTVSDELGYGAGIAVHSAQVTSAPSGVDASGWSGTGAIASAVTLPGGAVHTYRVTVVADAGAIAGTAAAECAAGVNGGFGNTAALVVDGAEELPDFACASPIEPTVGKTVADPVQNEDGSWDITYRITVANPSTTPASGLWYSLDDAFALPDGVTVDAVAVRGPDGAPLNPDFDGVTETTLLTGPDLIPAASAALPATRVYTVTLTAQAPAGEIDPAELRCVPDGDGGYLNTATLRSGSSGTVVDEDSACAPVQPQPIPEIVKTVQSTSIDTATGIWNVEYRVVVTNPNAQYSTRYDLNDELHFGDGAQIVSAVVSSSDAVTAPGWNGSTVTAVSEDVTLAAGASDTYTVTVLVDPASLDDESAAADCRIDEAETGTGYLNVATVTAGSVQRTASACTPITDPSVTKTAVGQPVQDAETGLWTLEYEVTVTNRSTTSTQEGLPYTLEDAFEFPAGTEVADVEVRSDEGTPNPEFDGSRDTTLATGLIGPAEDEATPRRHVYLVTVTFKVVPGSSDEALCDPLQGDGGLRNEVELAVGSRTSGAEACADLPEVLVPTIHKSVVSQEQLADGTWAVDYVITVGNPSNTTGTEYSLEDRFALGDGMQIDGTPTVTAPDGVEVESGWDGESETSLAESVVLPAGGSHEYAVSAVVDAADVLGSAAAGDCTMAEGESGTGMTNLAVLHAGADERTADACARAWDPGVTKTQNGAPLPQADGSWLLSYTLSVQNPAPVSLRYELRDQLSFPEGTEIVVESAVGRDGAAEVEDSWNGTDETVLVVAGTLLREHAVHVYDIVVRATLPSTQSDVEDGWTNTAEVRSSTGGVVSSEARVSDDLLLPRLSVQKTASAPDAPKIGDLVEYVVTATNVGDGAFTSRFPAVVWDALHGVLDDAEFVDQPTIESGGGGVALGADDYRWSGPLAPGESVAIRYSVEITEGGDALLRNIAFQGMPTDEAPRVPQECAAPACAVTETGIPAMLVQKKADREIVSAGENVTYTVSVTGTGQADLTAENPAVVTDDLAQVLRNADLVGEVAATAGDVELVDGVLTWTGPLAVGETVEIVYTVTVHDETADGVVLVNTAAADPSRLALAADGEPASRTATAKTTVTSLAVTGPVGLTAAAVLAALLLMLGMAFIVVRGRRRAV
ncbi:hypothetical protein [Microbacterium sp.]|uniref:DUF7927 domain-containing protein n=1 Tax=Microbacterium sp. TaxID=51671 RepID=UPI0039E439B2